MSHVKMTKDKMIVLAKVTKAVVEEQYSILKEQTDQSTEAVRVSVW